MLRYYESYWDQVSRDKTLLFDRYEKGLLQGRVEGKEEGKLEGERLLLERQLRRKFGEISARYINRIRIATADELLVFGDRLLEVEKLEKIFEEGK